MSRLWIVTPCFFDVQSFQKLRKDLLATAVASQPEISNIRFILVDDTGGQDQQLTELKDLQDTEIFSMPYNLGHQGAIVYALRKIGQRISADDFVATLDSDGEDLPGDLPALLKPLLEEPERLRKVSLARRTSRKESLGFKAAYFVFKAFFRIVAGKTVRSGNFAAFRGQLLKEIIFHPHFDQCYSSSFISLPLSVCFVPLARGKRYFGKSRMGYFGLVTHGLRMLMPFSEIISVRGILFSFFNIGVALAGLLGFGLARNSFGFLFFSAYLQFFAILLIGFSLLFVTFSQAKSRVLRDYLDNNGVPGP